jgi:hypothetical protein
MIDSAEAVLQALEQRDQLLQQPKIEASRDAKWDTMATQDIASSTLNSESGTS